jgi:hypothetical protein
MDPRKTSDPVGELTAPAKDPLKRLRQLRNELEVAIRLDVVLERQQGGTTPLNSLRQRIRARRDAITWLLEQPTVAEDQIAGLLADAEPLAAEMLDAVKGAIGTPPPASVPEDLRRRVWPETFAPKNPPKAKASAWPAAAVPVDVAGTTAEGGTGAAPEAIPLEPEALGPSISPREAMFGPVPPAEPAPPAGDPVGLESFETEKRG